MGIWHDTREKIQQGKEAFTLLKSILNQDLTLCSFLIQDSTLLNALQSPVKAQLIPVAGLPVSSREEDPYGMISHCLPE